MGLKENIKSKRIERKMTLEDLAKNVGVSRQTIQRYESGVIGNIPSDKIESIAKALDTSPAYLMGWTVSDGDIANAFINDNLEDIIDSIKDFSPSEKEHFKNYLHLHEINRKDIDKYTTQLLSLQEMQTSPQLNAAHTRTDINIPEGTETSDNDVMDDDNF